MEYFILLFFACMGMCTQVCAQLWRPLSNLRCLSSGVAQFGFLEEAFYWMCSLIYLPSARSKVYGFSIKIDVSIKLWSSCLQGRYLTDWAVFQAQGIEHFSTNVFKCTHWTIHNAGKAFSFIPTVPVILLLPLLHVPQDCPSSKGRDPMETSNLGSISA